MMPNDESRKRDDGDSGGFLKSLENAVQSSRDVEESRLAELQDMQDDIKKERHDKSHPPKAAATSKEAHDGDRLAGMDKMLETEESNYAMMDEDETAVYAMTDKHINEAHDRDQERASDDTPAKDVHFNEEDFVESDINLEGGESKKAETQKPSKQKVIVEPVDKDKAALDVLSVKYDLPYEVIKSASDNYFRSAELIAEHLRRIRDNEEYAYDLAITRLLQTEERLNSQRITDDVVTNILGSLREKGGISIEDVMKHKMAYIEIAEAAKEIQSKIESNSEIAMRDKDMAVYALLKKRFPFIDTGFRAESLDIDGLKHESQRGNNIILALLKFIDSSVLDESNPPKSNANRELFEALDGGEKDIFLDSLFKF